MLGFVAGAFAWGAVKAAAHGVRRSEFKLHDIGLAEVTEEILFRAGLMGGLGALGLSPGAALVGQAAIFGMAHDGNEPDAALGGILYGHVYERHGLLASTAVHVAHNLGVYFGAK